MSRRKRKRSEQAPRASRAPVATRREEHPRRIFTKQRLREWGVWRRSWHCGPGRVVSWWGKVFLDQFMPVNLPLPGREVDETRAQETHELIEGLDALLRLVLLTHYVVGVHASKEEKARACGLSSSQRYYEALARAHDGFEIRSTVLAENISRSENYLEIPYCARGLDSVLIDIVV